MLSIINKHQKFKNLSKQINNIYFNQNLIYNNIYENNNNKLYYSNSRSTLTLTSTLTSTSTSSTINKKQIKIKNNGETIKINNYGINKFIEEFNYPYDDILAATTTINGGGGGVDNLMVQPKTSYKDKLEVFEEVLSISMDEAGKGALLGPLFISCVVLDDESEKYLKSMGVTDSKKLSPKRREYLYDIIIEHALYYQTIILTSEKIDQRRELHTMNQIETNLFYQLIKDSINNLPKNQQCKIIIDSIEMNTQKYSQPFKMEFPPPLYQIYCETKADHKFISVGAASIIAKVERDRWMKQLETNTSHIIGSGYPSDPLTISYVNNFFKKYYVYPNSMRKSWKFTGADKEFDNLSSTLDDGNNKNIIDQDDELLSLIHKQKERENNLLNLELQQSFSSSSSSSSSPSNINSLTKKEQRELLKKEKESLKLEKEALKLEKENKRKEKQLERERNKQNKPPTTKQILDLLLLKLNNLESKIEQIQKKQEIIDNYNNNNINSNNNNNNNNNI
ncbi:hypothetical protein DDB_G0277705 [Dictyostelium discoideum AX4]|uniref:Ribonuclease n=1 Tax=Dictyostelium discoideum TaxID=44689 RepID=Q54ZA4_DICDI|nr:hypothetical protein DDB_G0277705 [Dictyostelium discoideum AX4]EAL68588.1 hypothetical protein DDB_G0277705 [Dictyostelium discoideum AX4]|eukprot:XP_642511.1 hypothetical protein DDB_G0277705 [Dictyostelium discoideum AX4]